VRTLPIAQVENPSEPRTTPEISVVMCTRNRPDKIGAAVESVLANRHQSFDLTIVDQSTTPATGTILELIAEGDPRLTYIHVDEPGLSRAYNTGIRRSTGEIIAFTDDDCLVPTDWLSLIQRAFAEEPTGDLLYGQVVEKPTVSRYGAVTPALRFEKAERLSRTDGFRVIGMGANFAARRRLFTAIGGFDEVLGGGGPLRSSQDFDLAYRTYLSGSVILLRPEVTLLHDGLREPEDWPAVLRNYGVGDGAFYSKHIRCGDAYAFFLLVRQVSRSGSRIALKTVLKRDHQRDYFLGIFAGVRDGFKFKVDRRNRRYVFAQPTR
jgi:glycosyltransferase involved in cell wall biosynthesis